MEQNNSKDKAKEMSLIFQRRYIVSTKRKKRLGLNECTNQKWNLEDPSYRLILLREEGLNYLLNKS